MSHSATSTVPHAPVPGAPVGRRRRCRPRTIDSRSPRPSALLRAFFTTGLMAIAAAAGAGVMFAITGREWLHWVALHLLFLGGISQLVLGAGQFFTCAFLATDPPPRNLVAAQLVAWNLGTVLVAVGVPTATDSLVELGAALIAGGFAVFAWALVRMSRRSLQRVPWALRWYQASAGCLGIGALLGVLMATGVSWSSGSLLGAHLAFNLAGWLGTAIVGTLHTFFPSLTQTRLGRPRLQGPTYASWLTGVAALSAGLAFGVPAVSDLGWASLILAGVLMAVNLAGCLRAATPPLALPARLLATAHVFLLAGLTVALVVSLAQGAGAPFVGRPRSVLTTLLLVGWIGLTVAGSLVHLLAILGRIRSFARPTPAPAPGRDRALSALAACAVGGLSLARATAAAPLGVAAAALTVSVAGLLVARILPLAAGALLRTAR
jgi:nitrite reductase (NO-forming)